MWRRGKQTRPGRMYPDPAGDAREQGNLDAIEALASPTSPTSQNSDEDTVTLDTTIALNSVRAENENEADAIETYADLEKTNSSHRLLCEECEKRPAVARCTACQETLCARCFVLTHPPRPGGNEHDHLRHGKVRALCLDDTSGALQGTRLGTLNKGGARLCHELAHGMTCLLYTSPSPRDRG